MISPSRQLGLLGLLLVGAAHAASTAQTHRVDAGTGAETWELDADGVTLSLTQILPDQVRAFYVNRGFPLAAVEPYATSCVFMTVLRNDSAAGVVHYKLADWSIESGGGHSPVKGVEQWLDRFAGQDIPTPALIAFRWAQFPPEQAYEPGGDWNQGMLSTDLPAGERFDLIGQWDIAGKARRELLKNVTCAR